MGCSTVRDLSRAMVESSTRRRLRFSQVVIEYFESFVESKTIFHTTLKVRKIPAFLKEFVVIHDFNGWESLEYDVEKYWTHLRSMKLSDDETVLQMDRFFKFASNKVT